MVPTKICEISSCSCDVPRVRLCNSVRDPRCMDFDQQLTGCARPTESGGAYGYEIDYIIPPQEGLCAG
jgi:hypothetical protein